MSLHTRRDFLKATSSAVLTAAASQSTFLHANPLSLPIGIQLYSVREDLAKDFEGTLRRLASFGYQEVEAAGFYNHTPAQVKAALKSAGLTCPSAHYGFQLVSAQLDQTIAFAHDIGLQYIVCPSPGRTPANAGAKGHLTLDDWKFSADTFNHTAEKVKAAGMTFAYHNHYEEFHRLPSGELPMDVLLQNTDPTKVHFEMDCGWVMVGGSSPADYLKRHPTRFCMLHVKDFVSTQSSADGKPPAATELGRGVMDYRPIFQAASKPNIKHIFVEQEGFDIPEDESLKVDADYMKKLTA